MQKLRSNVGRPDCTVLMVIDGLPLARGSAEAAVRRWQDAEWCGCAEDVLPSTEQDFRCWLDDKQEFPDALDMVRESRLRPAGSRNARLQSRDSL